MIEEDEIDPRENYLLAALPTEDYRRLLPSLKQCHLDLKDVLYRPGQAMHYVYFPLASIVSLVQTLYNGDTAEVAVIGREGTTGTPVCLGGDPTPNEMVVQHAGPCVRIRAGRLREEFARGGELQRILLHYTQALIAQMSQTAVCNSHHRVEQQLCRWLLLSLDRLPSEQLRMTHDLIARMLGVRREGVTRAAGRLQQRGLITYEHGRITVLDRQGVEAAACECYATTEKAYDRLIHEVWHTVRKPPLKVVSDEVKPAV